MDGLLFYLIFWIGWVITTFFYSKSNPDRLVFSAWILAAVFFSHSMIEIYHVSINMTGLFIIVTGFFYGSKLHIKRLLYFLLSSFIIMLATVCFLLYELFDPIWVLIKRELLIAIIISFAAWLLAANQKQRVVITMFGMILGELFYAIILLKYPFFHPVASLYFLDSLATAFVIINALNYMENIAGYFAKQFHAEEKEKLS